jgi:hypothetical protein
MHQHNKEGTIISPRDRGKTTEVSLVKENLSTSFEMKTAGKMLLITITLVHFVSVYLMFLYIL